MCEPGQERAGQGEGAKKCSTISCPTRARRSGPTPTCARSRPIELPAAVKAQVPARQRICPRQERGLGQDGIGAERLHRPLPRRSALRPHHGAGHCAGSALPATAVAMRTRTFVACACCRSRCVVTAFFLLPMVRLVIIGASGELGLSAYAAILHRAALSRDPRSTRCCWRRRPPRATLAIAIVAGLFLQRHRFPGRAILVAMLTFPLAFPGVVVGFMIILLAGRQGLIGEITLPLFGEKLVFAYSCRACFSAISISPFRA